MRPSLSTDDAVRILTARYPDLPAQAGTGASGTGAQQLAALAVARVAADLKRRSIAEPVTRRELDAATVLINDAHTGIEHAEVVITAAQYAQEGVSWSDIAALRGHAGGASTQKRHSRLQQRLGVRDEDLPTAPTLPAHTKRARALINSATAEPANPHVLALAADALGALLLAAQHAHVTGADLRAWIDDPQITGVAEALATAPRETAEAAHRVLAETAALSEGTRGDINHLVLAALDLYDPPQAQDQP